MPNETDIQHVQQQLASLREHLAVLIAQEQRLGAYAPPYVLMDMGADRREIARLKALLRSWGQPVADQAGDLEPPAPAGTPPQPRAAGEVQLGDRITIGDVHSVESNLSINNTVGGDLLIGQSINTAGAHGPLVGLLHELRRVLAATAGLPPDDAEDLSAALEAAIRAADQATPNTTRAAGKLAAMQAILSQLTDRPGVAQLSALVAQALSQLGAAA